MVEGFFNANFSPSQATTMQLQNPELGTFVQKIFPGTYTFQKEDCAYPEFFLEEVLEVLEESGL